jgi:hypothetical protein
MEDESIERVFENETYLSPCHRRHLQGMVAGGEAGVQRDDPIPNNLIGKSLAALLGTGACCNA